MAPSVRAVEESEETKKYRFGPQIKLIVFGFWLNILLPFVPAGIAVHAIDSSPVTVFTINFLALPPLIGLLSFALDDLSLKSGRIAGMFLVNASR